MCILSIFLFFQGLVISNGLEILSPLNFWGLLLWCFVGLLIISGVFVEKIPSNTKTYKERYEETIRTFSNMEREQLAQKLYA